MADSQRKTANLFDKSKRTNKSRVVYTTGEIGALNSVFVSDFTPIEPNTTYTLNIVLSITSKTGHLFALYDENKNFVNTGAHEATSATVYTFTTPSNVAYIRFNGDMASVDSIMLNTGSTALPYEPYGWVHSLRKLTTATDTFTTLPADIYADGNNAPVGISGNTVQSGTPTQDNPITPSECGDLEATGEHAGQFKIPISSANTTTPIYLGEVQTTRIIKKLVLTGEELWGKSGDGIYAYFGIRLGDSSTTFTNAVCTHYENVDVTKTSPAIGFMLTASSKNLRIRTNDVENVTLNDFTSYLARQYAAGTPVTVWYVLGTPKTGIVNEPIRKIGDYADTVSGITIPTITSKDTFDVDTTLKPSEVELTYTGWHDANVQEWDGSQWNE